MKKIFTAVPVLGFAYSRSKVAEKLDAPMMEVCLHLIKLWRYPNSENVDHWKQEVYNLFHRTYTLKSNNKYPKAKFIFDSTYVKNKDKLRDWSDLIAEDYGPAQYIERTNYSWDTAIYNYFDWLSNYLSEHGVVLQNTLYAKLKELGFGRYR